jgi:hypothetical protein
MVFAISPSVDTSHAIYHVSPVLCPKQEPEATSGNIRPASFTLGKLVTSNLGFEGSVSKQESRDIFLEPDSCFRHHSLGPESSQELEPATSSFNEEISSSLDNEGAAMNSKELPSSTPDAGDGEDAFELEKYPEREESATNMLVLPNIPHVNRVQLDQESSVALNSFQKSHAADHSVEMGSDKVVATFISSKGNKDLVEAAVSKVENCEDSADGMMDLSGSLEPLDCQIYVNNISPNFHEAPEEEVKRQVDVMVDLGKMKPSNSEYVCHVTLPMKRNVSGRFCEDYRLLSCNRICMIQDAEGRQWERSCRDFQIHHVQPN